VDSTKTIVCYDNGSFYRSLSAEAGSKHGLNPTVVIYDELAQARDRDLYDVLDTSMGAREEPLFITISTQSNDPLHILSQIIDDGLRGNDPTTVTHLYAVPDDAADIWDEKIWKLANPALDDFLTIDDMRAAAQRAKRMPSFEAAFRNLRLNQRVDAQSPLIPRAEWESCQGEVVFESGEDVYLGLDLSGTTDLTAMVAISAMDGDRCKAWFWKPADLVKEHEHRDRVPYSLWVQQGVITATPGRTVNHAYVAERLAELASEYCIKGVSYDRWRINDLRNALDAIGVMVWVDGKDIDNGGLRLVPWGQGFKDMAPALDAFEVSVLERRFKHDGNPCLTWNMSNGIVLADPAGNRKLDKSKTRFRIDGAVAAAMAVGLKSRDVSPVEPEFEMFFV
jgi:phage terminase large subunit-like protein